MSFKAKNSALTIYGILLYAIAIGISTSLGQDFEVHG